MSPEYNPSTWEAILAMGGALLAGIGVLFGVIKLGNTARAPIYTKIGNIEKELSTFKEHVAKNYPSHRAMQACSDNISKHIDERLKTQSAEMQLFIGSKLDALEDKLGK